jgi:hypothetical protein
MKNEVVCQEKGCFSFGMAFANGVVRWDDYRRVNDSSTCLMRGERKNEASRPQAGASRARSGEQNVSQGNLIYIVPLPAWR